MLMRAVTYVAPKDLQQMAKAKPTKHTSAELQGKAKAALANKGGGKAGQADRKGGKVGHAKYKCFVCSIQASPSSSHLHRMQTCSTLLR